MAEDSARHDRGRERDGWDKAEIILKPVGGMLTAVAVAVLGFWTSAYLRDREGREATLRERLQTQETNARLYSELTSHREESESALRKDMFKSIIESFLRSGQKATSEQEVLNLELLVYNFHESLNLTKPGRRGSDEEADAHHRGGRGELRRDGEPQDAHFSRA